MAKDIEIVDNRFAYDPTLKPQFLVLGYLDEYLGRDTGPEGDAVAGITMVSHSPADRASTVERFYPSESYLVDDFCEALVAWGSEAGLAASPTLETGKQGHITVRCKESAQLINACYQGASRSGLRGFAQIHRDMFPPWDRRGALKPEFADARFSYLLGCHRRYGNGHEFQFWNAVPKVDVVVELLEELGCEWLQREWRTQTIPRLTKVRFEPTGALRNWLGLG